MAEVRHIYLLSDATGETVERVVRAAMTQFKDVDAKLHRRGGLRTQEDIIAALDEARAQPGIVMYTLVNTQLAQLLRIEAEVRELDAVDLITPLLIKLADFLGITPRQEPGLLYQLDADYYKRIEAINYTVKQDDGQELRNLYKADVVLVGVSRTSKTPLSIYLAHKGYKVANIPLVKGIDPPKELFEINQQRVVGLIIDPRRLVELRAERLRQLRQNPRSSYADFEEVDEELRHCRQLYRRNSQWHVIEVTNKSVEESAAEILKKLTTYLAG